MELLRNLQLWEDPAPRSGPEAMAVDEWLLETVSVPVLRVYRWAGEWASLGYFGDSAAASQAFPGVNLVRRWTGGGMVDHRADWTYTLIVPVGEPLATSRGAESYRLIHQKLAEVIGSEGTVARLSDGHDESGSALCFANPVNHDVLGADGSKLAGAGQRRTRFGLLHQGSVALPCRDEASSRHRSETFASGLSSDWSRISIVPDHQILSRKCERRYASPEWMARR